MSLTPGMQDGTVIARESWLWGVSQSVDPRIAARVGTGVQPLQSEIYMYSRVLDHVHSYSSVTSSRVVNPDFYLPLVHFPLWSQVRCREREFLHRPGMGERYVYGDICICLHRKPQPILWLLFIPLRPLKSLHTDGDVNLSRSWG